MSIASKRATSMKIVELNQVMLHFQEDILTNSLSKLHLKSLLRFTCVSKFWKTLIDEQYFSMKHLIHAKNDQNSQKFLVYQLLRPNEDIFSIYCCPLSSAPRVEDVQELCFPLNVEPWYCQNLSTRESIVLPSPKFSVDWFTCLGMSFDSACGDYKILKISQDKAPSEIFELKSGSWRIIDEHPRDRIKTVVGMHPLAFRHGAFHWVSFTSNSYFGVSSNISHEMYGEIPLPKEVLLYNVKIGNSVSDGILCPYSNGYHQKKSTFYVWVMKDYGV
ncbi:putative F-box protein [Capsicum galapagoense]